MANRTGSYDSAAAFLLAKRPSEAITQHSDGVEVEANPNCAHVVARFSGAVSGEDALERGTKVVQQGLDMMSILGKADLLTHLVPEEFIVSWRREGRQILRIGTTTTFKFGASPVTVVHRDAKGNVIPNTAPPPRHHIGFRYFRLSQTSADLYDAYRNMYLAFELLLSSAHPPGKGEGERNWLTRALKLADEDLVLSRFLGVASNDVAADLLVRVYDQARLPLFHAKAGRTVVTPQESLEEREQILSSYELLTRVVLEMAERWHNSRRMGGGVYFAWVYRNTRSLLEGARVLALGDSEPFDSAQRDLSHARYAHAVALSCQVADDPLDQRAPLIVADAPTSALTSLSPLTKVEIVKGDAPLLAHILDTPVQLDGVDHFEYRGATRIENTRRPKARFGR